MRISKKNFGHIVYIFEDNDDYSLIVHTKSKSIEIPALAINPQQLPQFLEALEIARGLIDK